jgi:hypothetical protein
MIIVNIVGHTNNNKIYVENIEHNIVDAFFTNTI